MPRILKDTKMHKGRIIITISLWALCCSGIRYELMIQVLNEKLRTFEWRIQN
jgi:hypothetical protein